MIYDFIEESFNILYATKTLCNRKHMKICHFKPKFTEEKLNEGFITNFPFPHTYRSYISETCNIPLNCFFRRCGIIPYTIINNEKHYCLGVDAKYGTLTDFGGSTQKYETFPSAAVRELEEESLGIFNFSSMDVYRNSYSVYDANNIIIFLHVKVNSINEIVKKFNDKYNKAIESENCNIIWINESIFLELIKSGRSLRFDKYIYPSMYKPVGDLLRSVLCGNSF